MQNLSKFRATFFFFFSEANVARQGQNLPTPRPKCARQGQNQPKPREKLAHAKGQNVHHQACTAKAKICPCQGQMCTVKAKALEQGYKLHFCKVLHHLLQNCLE
jgi:hypothetical protein